MSNFSSTIAQLASERNLGASRGVFGIVACAGQRVGPIIAGAMPGYLTYFHSLSIISVIILLWTAVYVVLQLREVSNADKKL